LKGSALVPATICLVVLAAFVLGRASGSLPMASGTITARKLVIQDDAGRARAILYVDRTDDPSLELIDKEGRESVRLSSSDLFGGGGLIVRGEAESSEVAIHMFGDSPMLSMSKGDGYEQFVLPDSGGDGGLIYRRMRGGKVSPDETVNLRLLFDRDSAKVSAKPRDAN